MFAVLWSDLCNFINTITIDLPGGLASISDICSILQFLLKVKQVLMNQVLMNGCFKEDPVKEVSIGCSEMPRSIIPESEPL